MDISLFVSQLLAYLLCSQIAFREARVSFPYPLVVISNCFYEIFVGLETLLRLLIEQHQCDDLQSKLAIRHYCCSEISVLNYSLLLCGSSFLGVGVDTSFHGSKTLP